MESQLLRFHQQIIHIVLARRARDVFRLCALQYVQKLVIDY